MFRQPQATVADAWKVIVSLLQFGAIKPIVAKPFPSLGGLRVIELNLDWQQSKAFIQLRLGLCPDLQRNVLVLTDWAGGPCVPAL